MMSPHTYTDTATIGALLRRDFRVTLDLAGVSWMEHKGLLDSKFIIEGTRAQFATLANWCEIVSA